MTIRFILACVLVAAAWESHAAETFIMETRLIISTCSDGQRVEERRIPLTLNSQPITIDREAGTVALGVVTVEGDGGVVDPETGEVIENGQVPFALPMIYIENLEQGKAELFTWTDDGIGFGDIDVPGFDSIISLFGRVTLDQNGVPERLKATLTFAVQIEEEGVTQACIIYQRMRSSTDAGLLGPLTAADGAEPEGVGTLPQAVQAIMRHMTPD